MRTRPRSMLLVGLLAVGLIVIAARGRGMFAGDSEIADHLPIDSLAAGVWSFDPAEAMDTWTSRMVGLVGGGEAELHAGLADLDERLGMSFRDEVLGAFGPRFAAALRPPAIESAVLGSDWSVDVFLSEFIFIAEAANSKRGLRALEALASLIEAEFTVDEDRLTIAILEGGAQGTKLHGRIGSGWIVLSGSAERAAEALAGFPVGGRLEDGADYARVRSQVDADAEMLTYVNLPAIRGWLEQSGLAQVTDSMGYMRFLGDDEWTGMGMMLTSVRADGGMRRTQFGPEPMTGLVSLTGLQGGAMLPLFLSGWSGALQSSMKEAASPDHGRAKRTMADVRVIGTVMEQHAIDKGRYPVTNGWVTAATIAPEVQPVYVRELPTLDAWNGPFLLWSDGENYRVVSMGADGAIDAEWSGEVAAGKTGNANEDIVFGNGQFLRWPDPSN